MASQPIEVAALGRPLFPGMLYDCRKDTFIPGVTLWDKKSLSEDLDSRRQLMTDLKFSSSDSLSSKSSLLDVSASLKASFLGGLVEVGGSAKFLRNTKSSNQQSRVTMYYSETSRFEQLTMTHLGQITYPQVFDQKTATHVVTAVLYGAQAFMVFDRTFSEEENKQEIEGELNVMVKKIPLFSIEGQGAVKMTDGHKKMVESVTCTFHGDVHLEKSPTTYMEAVEVYKKLPILLKENPQNAVPIKVWLYPLSLLDTKAAQLKREITTSLVSNTEDVIEELGEVERTCNDLFRNTLVNVFRDIKERLSLFQGSFSIYKTVILKALARVLPAIRGGEKDENSLEDILKIHYSSPFKPDMLNKWLDHAKSELNLLSSHTKVLEGILTEDSDRLNTVLLDPNIDVVVCLTFTSLKYEDQYLSTLKEFVQSAKLKDLDVAMKTSSSTLPSVKKWIHYPDVISKIRENLTLFKSFSEANKDVKRYRFIISAISDPSSPGSSIYLYENGKLTDTQFQPVSKPPPPIVKNVLERSVSLKLQKSPTGETVQYRVEYQQVNADSGAEEQWLVKNTSDEDFTLTGLEFGKQYLIRYRIVGKVGVSEASDTIGSIPSSDILKELEATDNQLLKTLETRLANSEAQIEKLQKEIRDKPKVAFSASLGLNGFFGPFNADTTVVYKFVFSNVGDAYKSTGIFTAPVRGVYYFSFFYHCMVSNPTVLALYRNGKQEALMKHHKSGCHTENGGNALTLLLEKGDRVYMVLRKNTWIWDNVSENVSMFSGFLINAM
ncbi:Neoverrucotoxin subunit beta [Anabarilius grahami]|uniref:Neoverrucotoxin subunit beta n=1 Tax=Anabarilius grahami TaxID=495550 RepID=A0A3N0Y8Q4_ANAGA|nr:Neoverrucotoxin subunit beta [Anabarilius grahami]